MYLEKYRVSLKKKKTETSKYLVKKSKEISLVVASERENIYKFIS